MSCAPFTKALPANFRPRFGLAAALLIAPVASAACQPERRPADAIPEATAAAPAAQPAATAAQPAATAAEPTATAAEPAAPAAAPASAAPGEGSCSCTTCSDPKCCGEVISGKPLSKACGESCKKTSWTSASCGSAEGRPRACCEKP